jgi:hypothetical protein
MLILGGSATVHDLTGANTVAVCFLIPLGVSIYVLAGGMRASLIADYSHSLVLYAILLAFSFSVYATSPILGSPARVWELLERASEVRPVEGNAGGSYLTMRSKSGLIFGTFFIFTRAGVQADPSRCPQHRRQLRHRVQRPGVLATCYRFDASHQCQGLPLGRHRVVRDPYGNRNQYGTRRCDTRESAGTSHYAVTCRGIRRSTSCERSDPGFLDYTIADISAAAALMGQSGALAMLFLLFLAVTSAVSTEQVAVSNILTYDIYAAYINPNPTEKQVLWVSRVTIMGYCVVMGAISTGFFYIGVSMGYLYVLMVSTGPWTRADVKGCIIGCAVVPVACCVSWRRCNGRFAVAGAIIGFITAISGWLGVTSALNNGVITVETTFQDYPMLTGNLLSIGVGGIITVGGSLIWPANFDWEITRAINNQQAVPVSTVERMESAEEEAATPSDEKKAAIEGVTVTKAGSGSSTPALTTLTKSEGLAPIPDGRQMEAQALANGEDGEDMLRLKKAFRFAAWAACSLTVILIFVIPLPLFFSSHSKFCPLCECPAHGPVYPVGGFTAYIVITILWLFLGLGMVGLYPIWEARAGLASVSWPGGRDVRQEADLLDWEEYLGRCAIEGKGAKCVKAGGTGSDHRRYIINCIARVHGWIDAHRGLNTAVETGLTQQQNAIHHSVGGVALRKQSLLIVTRYRVCLYNGHNIVHDHIHLSSFPLLPSFRFDPVEVRFDSRILAFPGGSPLQQPHHLAPLLPPADPVSQG